MHFNDFSIFLRGFPPARDYSKHAKSYKINLFTLQNLSSADSSADSIFNPITLRKEGMRIKIPFTVGMTRGDFNRRNSDCGGKSSRGWKRKAIKVTRVILIEN